MIYIYTFDILDKFEQVLDLFFVTSFCNTFVYNVVPLFVIFFLYTVYSYNVISFFLFFSNSKALAMLVSASVLSLMFPQFFCCNLQCLQSLNFCFAIFSKR